MRVQLTESLIKIGDGISSIYKRKSQAPDEEKLAAGYNPGEEVLAGIGIASVEEYAVMSLSNIPQGRKVVFDLSVFEQAMKVEALYINDPKSDAIITELFLPGNIKITEQRFSKNKTPVSFPALPLPPNVIIKIKALQPIDYIYLVLKPVVILETLEGRLEKISEEEPQVG